VDAIFYSQADDAAGDLRSLQPRKGRTPSEPVISLDRALLQKQLFQHVSATSPLLRVARPSRGEAYHPDAVRHRSSVVDRCWAL